MTWTPTTDKTTSYLRHITMMCHSDNVVPVIICHSDNVVRIRNIMMCRRDQPWRLRNVFLIARQELFFSSTQSTQQIIAIAKGLWTTENRRPNKRSTSLSNPDLTNEQNKANWHQRYELSREGRRCPTVAACDAVIYFVFLTFLPLNAFSFACIIISISIMQQQNSKESTSSRGSLTTTWSSAS